MKTAFSIINSNFLKSGSMPELNYNSMVRIFLKWVFDLKSNLFMFKDTNRSKNKLPSLAGESDFPLYYKGKSSFGSMPDLNYKSKVRIFLL